MPAPFIDLFCRVIDNYGDIGVCWRLAKDLQQHIKQYANHLSLPKMDADNVSVRLWVDDLVSFARIEPHIRPHLSQQTVDDICIMHWVQSMEYHTITPAPIVIEAFGTNLDEAFVHTMSQHTKCWLNLEYLSAEPWVEDFHGQSSPQPNGVPKYFFFPGFTNKTGGLIKEINLHQRIVDFQTHETQVHEWLASYIHPKVAQAHQAGARLVSVFCYPSAPFDSLVTSLLQQYSFDQRPTILLLPQGVLPEAEKELARIIEDYSIRWTSPSSPQIPIHLQRFDFIPQEQFDYLLSACDFNIVRGEDSFVRAIWSGKPFIWHIYEQQEYTHIEKLQAWLNSAQAPSLVKNLHLAWNHYAALNNPAIAPDLPPKEIQHQRQHYHDELISQFSLFWQATSENFFLDYQDSLNQLPSLSLSILSFYAQHSK